MYNITDSRLEREFKVTEKALDNIKIKINKNDIKSIIIKPLVFNKRIIDKKPMNIPGMIVCGLFLFEII